MRAYPARHRFGVALGLAAVLGVAMGLFGVSRPVVLVAATVLAIFAVLPSLRPRPRVDAAAWQRRVEREYRIEIEGSTITLDHQGAPALRFEWRDVSEVQHLSRKEFPPLWWRIVTAQGAFDMPDGGSCARELEERFIYPLPGYHEQSVVGIPAPPGFRLASSMWRRDDPYPTRAYEDF